MSLIQPAWADIITGLVGWWKMDEGTGTATTADSSGQGNTGNLVNSPGWVPGKMGQALSFDGATNYVVSNNNIGLSSNQARTVTGWFTQNSLSKRNVLGFGSQGGALTFDIIADGGMGKVYGHFYGGGNDTSAGAPSYSAGVWYHFALVYDGATASFYLNGVFTNSKVITLNTTDSPFKIGTGTWTGIGSFNGLVDDVRVYNRALTAQDVADLYHVFQPNDGLVGWWTFDEGAGTVAHDSSGQGNNGSLAGSASWANGKNGKALGLDGAAGSKVVLGNPASLDFGTGSFSYGMWVYPVSNIGSWDMPWNKGGSSAVTAGFDIELGTGAWVTGISDGTRIKVNNFLPSGGLLNQWTHIFVVVDKSVSKLYVYVNGTKTNTDQDISGLGSVSNAYQATIGSFSSNLHMFNGYIDDVRIYSRALSAAEVAALYRDGSGPTLTGLTTINGVTSIKF
ncbi:MAG: LamG domain-containing protein [Candidatus Omnitrophica bacterium]|nr:LamG domain-containing protein [Candidatus Omnitrophota bacterium]